MTTIPHLRPVVPGLDILVGESEGRFPHSHCFVIRGDTEVLVDAGCGPGRMAEVMEAWQPEMVLISHSHPDHCAGAWMLSNARIMSPQERSGSFWQFDAQSVRFAGAEMASRWVDFVTEHMGVREFEPDGHFEDGTTFDFGTITLQCHHAPGHTDDHYVFFEAHHGVAMTFDIDLTAFGPWYGHVESSITNPSDVRCPSAGTTTPKTGPKVHWSRR